MKGNATKFAKAYGLDWYDKAGGRKTCVMFRIVEGCPGSFEGFGEHCSYQCLKADFRRGRGEAEKKKAAKKGKRGAE